MKNRNPLMHPTKSTTKRVVGPVIIIASNLLLVISLCLLFVALPAAIRYCVTKELQLVEGTEIWNEWVDMKVPIFLKVYLFNVTNGDDVVKNGSRFHVQEVGPYVWEEKRKKIILDDSVVEDTVTYQEVVHYYFREDMSVGSQEDTVNVVNMPYIVASTMVYEQLLVSSLVNYVIDWFIDEGETLILKDVKVRELIFDGVKVNSIYADVGDYAPIDFPEEYIDGTYAFLNQKNGTPGKTYKISRGMENIDLLGKVIEYDGKTEATWWTDTTLPVDQEQFCNKINGTDGSLNAPMVTKNTKIYIFHHEICRSIYGEFASEDIHYGIPAYKFVMAKDLEKDVDRNPENACFCPKPAEGLLGECLAGTFRISKCKSGAPLIMSKPHFLDGDEILRKNVSGMNPQRHLHDSEMIVEPNSGAFMRVRKILQINVEMQQLPGVSAFEHAQPAYIPIAWTEEVGEMDMPLLSQIRSRVVIPLKIANTVLRSATAILILTFFYGIYVTFQSRRPPRKCMKNGQNGHNGYHQNGGEVKNGHMKEMTIMPTDPSREKLLIMEETKPNNKDAPASPGKVVSFQLNGHVEKPSIVRKATAWRMDTDDDDENDTVNKSNGTTG